MFRYLLPLLLLLASPAKTDTTAPPLPALFDVTGVAADDALNIRRLPDASSDIVGQLAPDETRVEITGLSLTGRWAQVNSNEATGWVAFRYLMPHPQPPLLSDLTCFGTEPFWNINFGTDGSLLMSTPESELVHEIENPPTVLSVGQRHFYGMMVRWDQGPEGVTSNILPGQCSDGMSDRSYALHYLDSSGYRGCCSLN